MIQKIESVLHYPVVVLASVLLFRYWNGMYWEAYPLWAGITAASAVALLWITPFLPKQFHTTRRILFWLIAICTLGLFAWSLFFVLLPKVS